MVFLFLELFHQSFNALFNREIFRRDIDGYVAVAAVKRSSLVKDVFERFVLVKDNAPRRDVCHPALNLVKHLRWRVKDAEVIVFFCQSDVSCFTNLQCIIEPTEITIGTITTKL